MHIQIEWWHNGKFLLRNETLLIESVKTTDRGAYVCIGRNEYGTVNRTINLIVLCM